MIKNPVLEKLSQEIQQAYYLRAKLLQYITFCEVFGKPPGTANRPGMSEAQARVHLAVTESKIERLRGQRSTIKENEYALLGCERDFLDWEIGGRYLQYEQNLILQIRNQNILVQEIRNSINEIKAMKKVSPDFKSEADRLIRLAELEDLQHRQETAIGKILKIRNTETWQDKIKRRLRRFYFSLNLPFELPRLLQEKPFEFASAQRTEQ